MVKLTKRVVDSLETQSRDALIWDDELPGFGVRVFKSGKRSYLVQYRAAGRTRRYTIGPHGVWTPETARREARVLLGQIAHGENPAEQRKLDVKAITIKELCKLYLEDADNGLLPGKGGRPKKASTITIDRGRINRHIIPLLGTRRVKDIASTDVVKFIRDVTMGKTKLDVKTKKRGRAIVRGGAGTASRTVGLLGSILTYACENGIIDRNPVHGVRKPGDRVKNRRLAEHEYRVLGQILSTAEQREELKGAVAIARLIALTGCRRGEIIKLQWPEFDGNGSCLRLDDSKEGASVRPIGLAVVKLLECLRPEAAKGFVVPGTAEGTGLIGFPRMWKRIVKGTALQGITPHVLRHSFASMADDLGFTESTIAALVGHARGTVTSRYIHAVDTALIMAADTIAGYIDGLLRNSKPRRKLYSLDRSSREAAVASLFIETVADPGASRSRLLPERQGTI